MIKTCKKPPVYFESTTGSFYSQYAGLPLKSCVSQIQGYQEGEGVPSPTNIRPLHAYSSADLVANGTTYTFSFGQNIYQGYIDWKRGVVVGTHKKLVLTSSNSWQKSNTYQGAFFMYWGYFDDIGKSFVPFLCDRAKSVMSTSDYVYGTCFSDAACGIRIMPENSTIQDWFNYLDAQVSAGTPVTIAYELATPIEIPLGGIQLLTQQGVNNIFADCGDTTLEYLKAGR